MAGNISPNPHQTGAPPQKKRSLVPWLLAGCGTILILTIIIVAAGTWWAWHKAKQMAKDAGLDPEQMQKHPALTTVKLITAMNPDIEIVSVDEDKNLITLRDKKSGKTVTMNLDEAGKGKIIFKPEGEEEVTVEAHPNENSGTVSVKSKEGEVKLGEGPPDKIPEWVPSYPGVTPQGYYTMNKGEEANGGFHFTTPDPVEKVIAFYQESLKSAGMKVTTNFLQQNGMSGGGQVRGEDEGKKHQVVVMAGKGENGTEILVTFVTK